MVNRSADVLASSGGTFATTPLRRYLDRTGYPQQFFTMGMNYTNVILAQDDFCRFRRRSHLPPIGTWQTLRRERSAGIAAAGWLGNLTRMVKQILDFFDTAENS